MAHRSFKELVETKYDWVNPSGGGPWTKMDEIMGMDVSDEKKAQDIMLTFRLSYRQARRWTQQYKEVASGV